MTSCHHLSFCSEIIHQPFKTIVLNFVLFLDLTGIFCLFKEVAFDFISFVLLFVYFIYCQIMSLLEIVMCLMLLYFGCTSEHIIVFETVNLLELQVFIRNLYTFINFSDSSFLPPSLPFSLSWTNLFNLKLFVLIYCKLRGILFSSTLNLFMWWLVFYLFIFSVCSLLFLFFYLCSDSPIHFKVYQLFYASCVIFHIETKITMTTCSPTYCVVSDWHFIIFPSYFVTFTLSLDTQWKPPGYIT